MMEEKVMECEKEGKFIKFNDFVKAQYDSNLPLYKKLSDTPPSFNKFKTDYVTGFGFSEWLASMDGITPNENQWYSIISTYVREGSRKVNDIPALVATLEKHNNIKIAPIYGILTVEYWQDRLSKGQAQVA